MAAEDNKEVEMKEEEVKTEEKTEEKAEEKAEDEAKEEPKAGLKPKVVEKPKELEEDASEETRPKISAGSVDINTSDSTLNVLSSNGGRMLMTLSQGGFQYLLAGARTTVGLTGGRYMFEVKCVETHMRPESQVQQGRVPMPKHLVRLGLSHAGSSVFLGDGDENVSIDSEGFFMEGKNRKLVSKKFGKDSSIAFLVNLEAGTPNANTISLFREGVRLCEPQPIPEKMLGKPLFPTITYKNVTLQVNYGPAPQAPLPFKCHMLAEAAKADCEVASKGVEGKCEIVVPVGLPEHGFFDWVDAFVQKNPSYVELSDRKILAWAAKSGLYRGKSGGLHSTDKPDMKFGIPTMDDLSVTKLLAQVAPTVRRNFVVPELRSNLLEKERKTVLRNFSSPDFKKVATVIMGEPSAEHKAKVQELLVEEKKEKVLIERRKKAMEEERKRLLEERRKKIEAAKSGKTAEEAKEGEEEKKEEMDEDVEVELTEEEKALWFRKSAVPDLLEVAVAKSYADFSIPTVAEGFDEVNFAWQGESESSKALKEWVFSKKLTQRVDDITPGTWFKEQLAEWTKTCASWRKLCNEWNNPKLKQALLEKRKAAKKKEAEAKGEEPAEDMEVDADDVDVMAVEDVTDLGSGEPLFANFAFEDWTLLIARVEFHLLLAAFKKDLDDADRPSFTEKDAPFYFNKYFKKAFNLKSFGTDKFARFLELLKDTVKVNATSNLLEALNPEDAPFVSFVKLAEKHRRERVRRLDAGDESAELKFPKMAGGGMGVPVAAAGVVRAGQAVTPRVGFAAGGAPGVVAPPRAVVPAGGVRPVGGLVPQKRPGTPVAPSAYVAKRPNTGFGFMGGAR